MRHRFARIVVVSLTLVFPLSLSALAQDNPPPFPREGAKKALDNEYVTIWQTTLQKGQSTGMRKLPLEQVTVYMDEGPVKFMRPDGTWFIEEEKMGSIRNASKGTIESEQLMGDSPVNVTVFQLKDVKVAARAARVEGMPGMFEGRPGATKRFETDRITVWDYTWLKGVKTPRHLHYVTQAIVYLVQGQVAVEGRDAPPHTFKVGEVFSSMRPLDAPHVEYAVGDALGRAISIEFKPTK